MVANIDTTQLAAQQAQGLTVGVVPLDGSVQPRLEIDDFIQDSDLANLYLLALQELMQQDWKKPFSYFQIAGIHGRPWANWDNVDPSQIHHESKDFVEEGNKLNQGPSPYSGYCSHSSILFPTWHRVYLAMLEQSVFLTVTNIASRFPEPQKKKYVSAAGRFRLPFWDPFLPRQKLMNVHGYPIYRCGVPIILMIPKVRVRMPEHPTELTEIDNPLYNCRFPNGTNKWDDIGPLKWADRDHPTEGPHDKFPVHTIRGITPSGDSEHSFVNQTLDNALSHSTGRGLPLGGKIYRMLMGPPLTYGEMSNTSYTPLGDGKPTKNEQNSVEGFHNDIHVMCGAGRGTDQSHIYGHMALNEYAAFDPIFWLHHANIDRIIAIWQALNPEKWFEGQPLRGAPTYVTATMTEERSTSPLVPFRKGFDENGAPLWWTPNEVRDCQTLGYTYPQISAQESDIGLLRKWVNDHYEWATIGGSPPPLEPLFNSESLLNVEVFPELLMIDGQKELHKSSSSHVHEGAIHHLVSSIKNFHLHKDQRYKHISNLVHHDSMVQWNVTIRVEKFALNGSFTIFVFLGDFCPDPASWHHEANMVGSDSIFANRTIAHCENCQKQEESKLLDSDTIPLTTPLVTYWRNQEEVQGIRVESLDPPHVIPFLRRNLHWRVVDPEGRIRNPDQVASFKVQVGSQIVHLPANPTHAPIYDHETIWAEITDSRPGGLNRLERF
ncbi:Di-copper centre-containing protein [Glonium stellatum]|uniref:tyrosinase n=1 Tax=Glonium stellatum TaxID=574774 RepID=A0A8E2JVK2_9PEZI|nr:Di-copper centre-containing protein [Glonium stellatum]